MVKCKKSMRELRRVHRALPQKGRRDPMTIKIDKDAKVPVYLQIAEQIKAQIISGALPRASTLPSERALAQILDVHRNTVVKAYSELKSDAWIESRQGVGYVVTEADAAPDGGEGKPGESAGRVN